MMGEDGGYNITLILVALVRLMAFTYLLITDIMEAVNLWESIK